MMESKAITEKLRILRDFGIVDDWNWKSMYDMLSQCRSDVELDRVCHKLIFDKLK